MRMLVLDLRCYPFLMHAFIRILCRIHEKMHVFEIFSAFTLSVFSMMSSISNRDRHFCALCVSEGGAMGRQEGGAVG